MKTSIATVSLSGTLGEKLEAIAAAKFDAVEIFENDLITFNGAPADVRRACTELGLDIVTLQPFRDFEGMPPGRRERAMDRAELYVQAGLMPADIDFIEVYDDYPVINVLQFEDLGFCSKGEGPDFIRANTFEIDGILLAGVGETSETIPRRARLQACRKAPKIGGLQPRGNDLRQV